MKNFIADLRLQFIQSMQHLDGESYKLFLDIFDATTKKTRLSNHIYFIRKCLNVDAIPNGFCLKYNNANNCPVIAKHLIKCSRNLMKSTIRQYQHSIKEINTQLARLKRRYRIYYKRFGSTCFYNRIHLLNSEYYNKLNGIKSKKLDKLIPSNNEAIDDINIVHTIPDNVSISEHERTLLNKGLNFIPTPKHLDKASVLRDLDAFFRRTLLRAHFFNSTNASTTVSNEYEKVIKSVVAKKSSFTPSSDHFPAIQKFIKKCKQDISTLDFSRTTSRPNLNPNQVAALKSLRKREDIIIKPADKGGKIVLWSKESYLEEGKRQLDNNPTQYKPETMDMNITFNNEVKKVIFDEIAHKHLPKNAKDLIINDPRSPVFYLLPKIHKLNCPGRPIVSATNCPTFHLAGFLDKLMTPMVEKLDSYVKDTNHALQIFRQFQFNANNTARIFTMDVCALYTSIPHADGLKALKYFCDQRPDQEIPSSTICRLAELVLKTNAFSFNGKNYTQCSGVAMGSRLGPSYACLFMGLLEKDLLSKCEHRPRLFIRYIDDIFCAGEINQHQIDTFVQNANSIHPEIKFTVNCNQSAIPFLDISVSMKHPYLETTIYYKPTDAHKYLDYNSCHPRPCIQSIPFSQFLRLRRICSNEEDFVQKSAEMEKYFTKSNFPPDIITTAKNKMRTNTTSRNRNKNSNRIPLVMTYHPKVYRITNIIRSNFKILRNHPDTKDIFKSHPLVAFRRGKNMRDLLVRSDCHIPPSDPGTQPCKRPRCRTCTHVNGAATISSPNTTFIFDIRNNFSCTSECVIYCLSCTLCETLYIGETSRRLNARFGEHLRNIEKKIHLNNKFKDQDDIGVSKHFNTIGHSLDNIKVSILLRAPTCGRKRKELEKRLMLRLNTMSPCGLNKR